MASLQSGGYQSGYFHKIIKYGWNTIAWAKNRYLRHFIQNLLGVKVHTSCKISKFCQKAK